MTNHHHSQRASQASRIFTNTRGEHSRKLGRARKRDFRSTEEIRGNISRYFHECQLYKPVKSHTLGNLRHTQTHGNTIVIPAGKQIVTTLFSVGSIAQCITSTGPAYTDEQNSICYFDLNPYQTTNNPQYGATLRPKDDRIILKHIEINMTVTNMSNAATIVDVYLLKCKSATNNNPFSCWNQGYLDTALNQATAVQGTRTTTGVSGYPDNSFYDTKPKESPTFKRFWKILHTKCLDMSVDQTDKLDFSINYNKMLKKEYIANLQLASVVPSQAANNNLYMPGTLFVMSVCRSAVVQSENAGSNLTTFSNGKVGYVAIVKSLCKTVPDNAGRLSLNEVDYAIASDPNTALPKVGYNDAPEAISTAS